MTWRAAYDDLAARARAVPDVVRHALACDEPPPRVGLGGIRRVVTTGVGSSAAHARLLAHLLAEHVGRDARFRALGAFLEPAPEGSCDDLLVVISQGLAPNARVALADLAAWRHVVVLTATDAGIARARGRADAADLLAHLETVGVEVRRFAAGVEEYGTLLRLTGPVAGFAAVVRYAAALAAGVGRARPWSDADPERVAAAVAAAPAAAGSLRALAANGALGVAPTLLASGAYAGLVDNVRAKLLEGLLVPAPAVWDLLDVAHGPFQQAFAAPATLLALTRPDAAREEELLARLASMLDPSRHRLVRAAATLPFPWCVFEHEALVNELVLAGIAAGRIDQARWPGQGRDRPLYVIGSEDEARASVPGDAGESPARRPAVPALATASWPEIEALLAAGPRVALIPLGATEQHGPHLPFATDTWIGAALAARLAARLPEAVACPTLAFGCSSEHAAFPGTLDLRSETLAAVVRDVVRSLARSGFAGAFVFSAHGGNYAALAAMLPELGAAAAPMPVAAFTDLAAVAATLARVAESAGVPAAAAGHHAGEAETSILLALRPASVRVAAFAPGHTASVADPQALFYPSLRDHAPSGVVGDPRGASATRAEAYLDAWVDLLETAYRRAKNLPYANGTQNA